MARPKKISKSVIIFCSILAFVVGIMGGLFGRWYYNTPQSYVIPEKVECNSTTTKVGNLDVNEIKANDLSIHFLELGNKYTGDCTFIKVGDIELLIDAGSRASSIPTITNYIDQYITDGMIEYVIVTHAHQDHYAGFATSKDQESIFDKYKIGRVIEFAKTNQKSTSRIYNNYLREKQELAQKMNKPENELINTALDCINGTNGASREYLLGANIKLQILYQKFYEEEATTENDYSVCCQIVQGEGKDKKYYLFTGDLEAKGEASLVDENGAKGKNENMLHPVELYKAGHHGSKTSSSEKLLNIIQPKCVCVCCCAGSSEYTNTTANQFPTQEFIDRISVHTTQVFVTTLCTNYAENKFESMNGNIVITASNIQQGIVVSCSKTNTVLKDTEWIKKNRNIPKNWQVSS